MPVPIVLAQKKDCSPRFCGEYRKELLWLNATPTAYTDWTSASIHLQMHEYFLLWTPVGATGKWRLNMQFSTKLHSPQIMGLEGLSSMLLGLCSALWKFQSTIDVVLSAVKLQLDWVYLNGITIFSRTTEEHIEHVCNIFSLLPRAGVGVNLKEFKFFTDKIAYLRHMIRTNQLEAYIHTTDEKGGIKAPRIVTKLKPIMGLCNMYRRLIQNSAQIASPFNAKVKNGNLNNLTTCWLRIWTS